MNSTEIRRVVASALRVLLWSCLTVFGAGIQESLAASTSLQRGPVKLPVVDKQDIRFTHLSADKQSLQNRIPGGIAQDKYGFLWIGSYSALYRYDGYNLKAYQHDPDDPNSLSNDSVFSLHIDRAGIVWVGTAEAGLNRLDPASDTITHFRRDPKNPGSLSADRVWCIYEDRGGALWVGTEAGLDRLDPASGTFRHYKHDPQDPASLSNNITTLSDPFLRIARVICGSAPRAASTK
jgi:ligand-binding sensor domain-containing protein